MAKESVAKESPVAEALRKLKEEEIELNAQLKPIQEAILALEKILEKSSNKKTKPTKEKSEAVEEGVLEFAEEAQ